MNWSPQQDAALRAVSAWLDAPGRQQVFYLAGYAGTGKTTLARHLAQGVGRVRYVAYTGKAAHVLRRKGCADAQTIHSLIYLPRARGRAAVQELVERVDEMRRDPEHDPVELLDLERHLADQRREAARPMFTLNVLSEVRDADLIVVDECSMVGRGVAADLESFKVPMLVLGDPAQLPPVGDSGAWTNRPPDFLLTEIHRQARDNPIIELATRVREGRPLDRGVYGESRVVAEIEPSDALRTDQILCGRNRTRRGVNRRVRQLLGHDARGWQPVAGDKLVCLRNDHEAGLLNGSTWAVVEAEDASEDAERVDLRVSPLDYDGEPIDVEAWTHHLRGLPAEDMSWWDRAEAQEFDYGYGLTAHKAQGSQWDDVIVFDESSAFRQHARRWLYTAITRAAERVTVVR